MIIRSRAPLRIGLAGGGTDVSPYCDVFGGAVLNATVDMYAYCTIIPTKDNLVEIECADQNQKFVGKAEKELDVSDKVAVLFKGVYNHIVKHYNKNNPLSFRAYTYADAPAGSGLGTSSTMIVTILKAFVEWLQLPMGEYDIAKTAYIIEREELKFSGGRQDQYAATFGGFNFMEFSKDNAIINPLRIKNWIKSELESSLVLYFTGVSRSSAEIIDNIIKVAKTKEEKPLEMTHKLKESAYKMKECILKGDFGGFSDCLKDSWEAKKGTSSIISNENIEKTYNYILENGGQSAKISGAGGGGFMMIYADPSKRYNLIKKLKELGGDVYTINFTNEGTEGWVIYDKKREKNERIY